MKIHCEHCKAWLATIGELDGFMKVTCPNCKTENELRLTTDIEDLTLTSEQIIYTGDPNG